MRTLLLVVALVFVVPMVAGGGCAPYAVAWDDDSSEVCRHRKARVCERLGDDALHQISTLCPVCPKCPTCPEPELSPELAVSILKASCRRQGRQLRIQGRDAGPFRISCLRKVGKK